METGFVGWTPAEIREYKQAAHESGMDAWPEEYVVALAVELSAYEDCLVARKQDDDAYKRARDDGPHAVADYLYSLGPDLLRLEKRFLDKWNARLNLRDKLGIPGPSAVRDPLESR